MRHGRRSALLLGAALAAACGDAQPATVTTAAPASTAPRVVNLDFRADRCPRFTGFSLDPPNLTLGRPSTVTVFAADPEEDNLFYVWSATAGRFTDVLGPVATYHCDEAGAQTLSVAAFDEYGCDRVLNIITSCVAR